MNDLLNYSTFSPGQPVFFQGESRQEFYGLCQGRFAKVKLTNTAPDIPMTKRLASAVLLEIIDQPGQLFGEISALLKKPHEFSVFSLDHSEATTIPASEEFLQKVVASRPEIGLKTCISLARTLHATLDQFAKLVECEDSLRRLQTTSAQALISVTKEIKQIGSGTFSTITSVMEFMHMHEAFKQAEHLARRYRSKPSLSVRNAVIPPPVLPEKTQQFTSGTIICRKGLPGDRLFIITQGVVEVFLSNEHRIQIAQPGSIIGEIAALENIGREQCNIRRTANVVCITPVSAIVIELGTIHEFFDSHPSILSNILFALTTRMDETMQLVSEVRTAIRELLNSGLRHFLEAHHGVATRLDVLRKKHPALERPFHFCAHQSRSIYNAFATALEQINPN